MNRTDRRDMLACWLLMAVMLYMLVNGDAIREAIL